jgi:excisionase family DNA binding protein
VTRVAPDQLELDVARVEAPPVGRDKTRRRREGGQTPSGRLALSPDEAAAVLGVSRDYFDQHVIGELRVFRRGRRILVALAELERWLDRSATRVTVATRA